MYPPGDKPSFNSLDWLNVFFVPFEIDQSDYFGFAFTTQLKAAVFLTGQFLNCKVLKRLPNPLVSVGVSRSD